MIMRSLFLTAVLTVLISGFTFSQSKKELISDFDIYRSILEKAHAGLYKYHSKAQVDSVFAAHRKKINEKTSLVDYYKQVSAVLAYIGSLHDEISLPDEAKKKIAAEAAFFPFPVKLVDGKLLINASEGTIPAGAEIVSINGKKVKEILPALYKYYTTDGFNITGKSEGFRTRFPWYYRLEYGLPASFKVEYKAYAEKQVKQVVLKPVSWKEYNHAYKKRYSLAFDTATGDDYSFRLIDSLSAGILTVPTFSLGNASSGKHEAYKKFLHETFAVLKQKNIRHLIVDIRENGGGSDPNDLLTFSYLARQPFKENAKAFTLFQELPYKQYSEEDTADIRDLEENFHDEHNQLVNGRYYQNPSYNPFWQPDSLAFKGKIYLLVGPAVASAASLFASLVKSEGYATVIGEETMGGYYGHTGHNPVAYLLPHSGFSLTVSTVDLEQFVTPKKDIPFGRGIMPDIEIHQSQEDFMKNRDAVMERTLQLISH